MNQPVNEDQLYAKFGRTAELAQSLEVEAGNVFLAIVAIGVKTDEITDEQRDFHRDLVNELNRRTLGDLLRHMRPLIAHNESVVSDIDTALERRNYLMHGFFRTHNFRIFSDEGRGIMSRELDEIHRSLAFAVAALSAFTLALEKLAGREGESKKYAEQFMAQGKRVGI